MGSLKNSTFREGSRKANIEWGLVKKGALTVCRFKRGAWQERGGGVFEDTPVHIMTIWKVFLNKIEFKMLYLTLKK